MTYAARRANLLNAIRSTRAKYRAAKRDRALFISDQDRFLRMVAFHGERLTKFQIMLAELRVTG